MRSMVLALSLSAAAMAPMPPAFAQPGYDTEATMSAQREAMKALAMLDGEWRGPAKSLRNDGGWHSMVQTERVGTTLDGTVRVLEGRGFEASGELSFTAFAVISYSPTTKAYTMRSYSSGRVGDFRLCRPRPASPGKSRPGPI